MTRPDCIDVPRRFSGRTDPHCAPAICCRSWSRPLRNAGARMTLLHGTLLLFTITSSALTVTRTQLLKATRSKTSDTGWTVQTENGPLRLLTFPSIEEKRYSTYLSV